MLDFDAVREKRMTFAELTSNLTPEELRSLSHEMVDTLLTLIADSTDADVVFQPVDPVANDPYASGEGANQVNEAWTLGHVILHTTASAEEAAFLAAEMARGVELHGRSRYETPWESVTTVDQLRQRLQESRRMRVASLDLWPDKPHMDIYFQFGPDKPNYNALQRFALGLRHEADHLEQIREIVRQAQASREPAGR
jgi:hypothetical protein